MFSPQKANGGTPIPGWVNDYVGIPFAEHGRSHDGVDCWGLVCLIYDEQFGITLPDFASAYDDPEDAEEVGRLISAEVGFMHQVPVPVLGDVVLLRLEGWPAHVGLVVAPGRMLHVMRGVATVHEPYDGMKFDRRVLGFYRYHQGVSYV